MVRLRSLTITNEPRAEVTGCATSRWARRLPSYVRPAWHRIYKNPLGIDVNNTRTTPMTAAKTIKSRMVECGLPEAVQHTMALVTAPYPTGSATDAQKIEGSQGVPRLTSTSCVSPRTVSDPNQNQRRKRI
jgi:hypothetical protein